MGEWKEYKLGDVADITSSKRIFFDDYVDSGIPFYRSKEIIEKAQKANVSTELFITNERFDEIKNKFGAPSDGDILISAVGERAGIPYCVNNDGDFYFKDGNLIWFRNFKNHISSEFLVYYFNSFVGQQALESTMIGSAQKALTIIGLKGLGVSFPSLPEQKTIASILSSLDDKIDLLHRQNKTLGSLAETLFRQWFVEDGTENILIGNVASVTTGKGLKREEFIENGEFPILGANGEIGRTNKFLTESKLILTGRVGTLGKVYLSDGKVWISDNVLIVNPFDENFFYPIYFYLKTIDFENLNVGSTQPLVTQTEVKKIELKIPTKQHFEEFAKMCSYNFEKIKTNQIQIRTLIQLRDTLLPKLMSGEIRLNCDLYD